MVEHLQFLEETQVRKIAQKFETPVYVYDERRLIEHARLALAFPHAYGLTIRYAMKANPNRHIIDVFKRQGILIDASSEWEAERAILAGVEPHSVLLTAQEQPSHLQKLIEKGVLFNATSLRQIDLYGELFPGTNLSVRINPGLGSGSTNRTNVGGPASSFGVWHGHLDRLKASLDKYDLTVYRIHTHIGSGADPKIWQKVAEMSLSLVDHFPWVEVLNLGGGFKVGRMTGEVSSDLRKTGDPIKGLVRKFFERTGRKIRLEIEPGTFLTAPAGALIATIEDEVDTGSQGYRFIKVNTGMTEILRPSLYGAQHPLVVVTAAPRSNSVKMKEYIVVGHCCESGDILTPEIANPESLSPRLLLCPRPGDFLVIEGTGAYCASMNAKNYNSFPEAPEILITRKGDMKLIRKRQTLVDMVANETTLSG